MLHFTRTEHCPMDEAPHTATTVVERISAAWRALLYRRKLRATERALLALSDTTLKDIGVHRSEISSLVRHGDTRLRVGRPLAPSRYY